MGTLIHIQYVKGNNHITISLIALKLLSSSLVNAVIIV